MALWKYACFHIMSGSEVIPAITASHRVMKPLRSSLTNVTAMRSSMSYTAPCFLLVLKCLWIMSNAWRPLAGVPDLACSSLKMSSCRAKSPSQMLVSEDMSFASRVTNLPESFKASTVMPYLQHRCCNQLSFGSCMVSFANAALNVTAISAVATASVPTWMPCQDTCRPSSEMHLLR